MIFLGKHAVCKWSAKIIYSSFIYFCNHASLFIFGFRKKNITRILYLNCDRSSASKRFFFLYLVWILLMYNMYKKYSFDLFVVLQQVRVFLKNLSYFWWVVELSLANEIDFWYVYLNYGSFFKRLRVYLKNPLYFFDWLLSCHWDKWNQFWYVCFYLHYGSFFKRVRVYLKNLSYFLLGVVFNSVLFVL